MLLLQLRDGGQVYFNLDEAGGGNIVVKNTMNAGQIYEMAIGALMVVSGGWLMCIDFGFLPRREKAKASEEFMPLKKNHPWVFSFLGPTVFVIGVGQILRPFHLFG